MVELDALMAEVAVNMRVILPEYVRINRAKRYFAAFKARLQILFLRFFRILYERVASYGFGLKQGRFGNTRQSVTKSALLNIK